MNDVNLQLRLLTGKADAEMEATAKKGRDLFEKRGFKLNLKGGDLPLGRITGDFEKFQGSLDAATARVLAFTATTGAVYGLSTAFTRLFTDSVKLEKQLAGIQAILQTSNSNLQKFSDELFNVANATGQSFDVAAEAASEFARQGLSVEETLKATNSALTFSKIAGVNAAQAVENLTASINTFSNEALSYTDVVDTIVSLDNAFAISAGGIADGLKRVGSVASESGIQLKEIASLISVVQQVSARGAPVISNGLKTIFTRLGRSKVQESLNGIGVSTQDANGEFRSQIDILTDLSNRLDSLSDSQRAFILEQVAGVYQINTLQATLKALNGEYSLLDKAVKVASDSSGNAADRLKILTDTTDANLQKLKNNVTQFLAEVGKATVKPLLDNFVGVGNTILETLNLGSAAKGGEDAGINIGKVLLNGISSALSGPGTILIVATVGKLLTKITKDAASALLTLSGLKNASLVDSQTQKTINEAIAQGNKGLVARLATTTSIVEKMQILDRLLTNQSNKQGAAQINQAVDVALSTNKIKVPPKGKAKGHIPTYSRGFIPESIERQEKMGARYGGYAPGKVVPSPVGGVMNTAESVVYASSKHEPFINPPKNSIAGIKHKKKSIQSTGIDPYSLMTSDGFIPNFAKSKYNKNANGELISIDYLNKVSGQQSSRIADGGVDNIENLKYNVISLNSPDYIKGIKEKLKGPFTEDKARFISNIALKNGYSRKDTQDFIDNLRESGRIKPLPMPSSRLGKGLPFMTNLRNKTLDNALNKKGKKNKLDVNIQDQINGFATNVGSKMFEKTGLRALNKNSSEVFVLADVQNSRMDILDSNKKPIGEIKAGRITRDNLVSKAIESQALQLEKGDERSSFPFYKNNNEEPISFEKPFTLVKRYKNSTAALPFSNKGFIPNFAAIARRIGILDGDVLDNPEHAAIVNSEMERLRISKTYEYYEHLGNLALEKRKSGGLKKVSAIYGRPGSGKTSLAFNLDKEGKTKKSDDATFRKTTRIPIIQESDINKVDEVISTKASISTAEQSLRSGFLGGVDRFTSLETSPQNLEKLASRRVQQVKEGGQTPMSQGRSVNELQSLVKLKGDGKYIPAVAQSLGINTRRIGQTFDEKGNLVRSRVKEKYNIRKRKIALAYGAFAPFTKGHEKMFTQARSLGFKSDDIVFAVSSGAKLKAGDEHSYRTTLFPANTRSRIIEKATGAKTTRINSSDFRGTIPSLLELSDGSYVSPAPGSIALTGDDKGSAELAKYLKAGYETVSGERSDEISGTKLREAIENKDIEGIRRLAPKGSADYVINNLDVISNRSNFLQKLVEKKAKKTQEELAPIEEKLSRLPARVLKTTPPEIAEEVRQLRKQRDKIKESNSLGRTFARATSMYKGLQFKDSSSDGFIPNFASRYTEARKQKRDQLRASLFNIGDFAGGAIKNVNAQTEFNQARNKNPNVEFDDKINQVGFKVERIPILDREFEAALRSKENNKEVTTKFENYAIDYLNGKGYSFEAGRNTLYGKENAAVDGYNIKQNFIELLEVKGGKWDAPDVNNKFGRFAPENLVDLGPQLVSKFFKEGNPDPNINDKIRIRNVLAIPNLTGGVFKNNIARQYPSANVEQIEKARQRTRPSGKKTPANMAWMLGVVEQMKESGATNASGFIPNFASRREMLRDLVKFNLQSTPDIKDKNVLGGKTTLFRGVTDSSRYSGPFGRDVFEQSRKYSQKADSVDYFRDTDINKIANDHIKEKKLLPFLSASTDEDIAKYFARGRRDDNLIGEGIVGSKTIKNSRIFSADSIRKFIKKYGQKALKELMMEHSTWGSFGSGKGVAMNFKSYSGKKGFENTDFANEISLLSNGFIPNFASDIPILRDIIEFNRQQFKSKKTRLFRGTSNKRDAFQQYDYDSIIQESYADEVFEETPLKQLIANHRDLPLGQAFKQIKRLDKSEMGWKKKRARIEEDYKGSLPFVSTSKDKDVAESFTNYKEEDKKLIAQIDFKNSRIVSAESYRKLVAKYGEKRVKAALFKFTKLNKGKGLGFDFNSFESSGYSNEQEVAILAKGFVPNFSPYVDRVMGLETQMSGEKATYSEFPFPHVRNKSQPTFGSAIADHGGLKNAMKDSMAGQQSAGLASGGFVPNFAAPPRPPIDLAYNPVHKARQKKVGGLRRRGHQVSDILGTLLKTVPEIYTRDKVLGDAGEGLGETPVIMGYLQQMVNGLAAYAGPNVQKFVYDAQKRGYKTAQSLQRALSRKAAKVLGPKYNAEGFIPNFVNRRRSKKEIDPTSKIPSTEQLTSIGIGMKEYKKLKPVKKEKALKEITNLAKKNAEISLSGFLKKGFIYATDGTLGSLGLGGSETNALVKIAKSSKLFLDSYAGTNAERFVKKAGERGYEVTDSLKNELTKIKQRNIGDFIPNFANPYVDKVMGLERQMSGKKPILGYQPGFGDFIYNTGQSGFAGAIADHGGLKNAMRDSVAGQRNAGLASGGFIPNFSTLGRGIDPSLRTPEQILARKERAKMIRTEREKAKLQERMDRIKANRGRRNGGGGIGPDLPDKESKMNSRLGALAALSFAIPTVTGMFSTSKEGEEPSKTQKIVEGTGEAIGAGIATATTVALIPALAPIAPIVGGAVFAYKALNSVLKANVPSVKDQVSANQKLITENESSVNALNETIRAQEQLSALQSSGADSLKMAKAQLEFNKSLSKIRDTDLVRTLTTEKDQGKREDAILKYTEGKRKETAFSSSATEFSQIAEKKSQERSGIMNFIKPSPLPDFESANWDAFLTPILDSLDLKKLSSEGLKNLKSVSEGNMTFESFLGQYGAELGLTNDQLKIASKTFKTFRTAYSEKSLKGFDEYAAGSVSLNLTLESQVSGLNKIIQTVDLEKTFRKKLEDLTANTALQNVKNVAIAGSNSRIKANQLAIDTGLDRLSATDIIKGKTKESREDLAVKYSQDEANLRLQAVDKLKAIIPEGLTPEKRDAIFQSATDVLARGSDISSLEETIKRSIGEANSNGVLEELRKLSVETIKAIYLLDFDFENSNREISAIEVQNIKAEQDKKNAQAGAETPMIGEEKPKYKSNLLIPDEVASLKKQIGKLEETVITNGLGSAKDVEAADKLKDLQIYLQKLESEDYKAREERKIPISDGDVAAQAKRTAAIGANSINTVVAESIKPLLEQRAGEIGAGETRSLIGEEGIAQIINLLEIGSPETNRMATGKIIKLFTGALEKDPENESFKQIRTIMLSRFDTTTPPTKEQEQEAKRKEVASNVARLNEQAGIGAFVDPVAKKAADKKLVEAETQYNDATTLLKKIEQEQVNLAVASQEAIKNKTNGSFESLDYFTQAPISGEISGIGETGDIGLAGPLLEDLVPYNQKIQKGNFTKEDLASLRSLVDTTANAGDKQKSDVINSFIQEVQKLIKDGLLTVREEALKDTETLQKELENAKKIIEEKTNQLKSAQQAVAVASGQAVAGETGTGIESQMETPAGREKIVEKYQDTKDPNLQGVAERAKEANQAQADLDQQTTDPDYLKRRKYLVSERLAQGKELTPEVMAQIDQEVAAKAQAEIENAANLVGQTYEAKPVTETPVRPNFFTRETAPVAGFEGVYSGSAIVNDYITEEDRALTDFASNVNDFNFRDPGNVKNNNQPILSTLADARKRTGKENWGNFDENPDFYKRMADPAFMESNWDRIVYPWLSNKSRDEKDKNAPISAQSRIVQKAGEGFKTPIGSKLGQGAMVKMLAELPTIYKGSKKTPDEKDSEAQEKYIEQFLYLARKGKSDGTPYSPDELKDIEDFTGQTLETRSTPGKGSIEQLIRSSLAEASAKIPKPSVSDFVTGKEGGASGKENTYAQRFKDETIRIAREKLAQGRPISTFTDENNVLHTQYGPYTDQEKQDFEDSLKDDETVPNMTKEERVIYDGISENEERKKYAASLRTAFNASTNNELATIQSQTGSKKNTMGSSYGKLANVFRNIEGATNFATSADSQDAVLMNETEVEKEARLALEAKRDEANKKLKDTLANPQTASSVLSSYGQISPEIINSPQVSEEDKKLLQKFNTIRRDKQTLEEQEKNLSAKGVSGSLTYRDNLRKNIMARTGDDRVFEDTILGRSVNSLNNFRKIRQSGKTDAPGFGGEQISEDDKGSILRRVKKKDWSEIGSVAAPELLKAIDDVIAQSTRTATSEKVLTERGELLSKYASGEIGVEDKALERSGLLKELKDLAGGLDALQKNSGLGADFQQSKDIIDQLRELKANENQLIGQVNELLQKINNSIPTPSAVPPGTTTPETPPATPPTASTPPSTETKVVTANINVSINGDSINDKQLSQLATYIEKTVSDSMRESAISTNSSIPNLGPPKTRTTSLA